MRDDRSAEDGLLHTLYRFYGTDDTLLYVGITCNPGQRLEAHRRHKSWWGSVARITLQQYESRQALATAELTAIHDEQPKHNIVGVTNGARRRATVTSTVQPKPSNDGLGFYGYDHSDICEWPEYRAVGLAIDELAHRYEREDRDEAQTEFERVLTDLARHMVAGKSCPDCRARGHGDRHLYAPYANDTDGDRVVGYYRCAEGHEWRWWVHVPRRRGAGIF